MYQINADEGLREKMAMLGYARRYMQDGGSYNTGATVSAHDAMAHVSFSVLGGLKAFADGDKNCGELLICAAHGSTAGGLVLINVLKATDVALSEEPISPADVVEKVRNIFALNISEAASVFGVSRPTIYQWTRLGELGQIRSRHDRERLKTLFRISKSWAERGPLHGRWLNEAIHDEKSVFDLLCDRRLDEKALLLAHDTLLTRQHNRREVEHNKAVATVDALRNVFADLAAKQDARRKTKASA